MYSDFEQRVIDEMLREERMHNPVHSDYRLARFVSRSAGKGRKRPHPVEVVLVVARRGGAQSWHKFPFDEAPAFLDGEWNLSTREFIDALLEGQSEPEWLT